MPRSPNINSAECKADHVELDQGETDILVAIVGIVNKRGLHARAAAKFVKLAALYDAEITVQRGDMTVTGQSIMGLMMLAAGIGTSITITAQGAQASEALAAVVDLVERKFDEGE